MLRFFNKKKSETIRDKVILGLFKDVDSYVDWYAEKGLYLPPGYETDPTGWTEELRGIQRAFRLLHEELNQDGELWDAKNKWKHFGEQDVEKIKELEADIQKGLASFGKFLFYLNDRSR